MFVVPSAWYRLLYQQLWRTLKKIKQSAQKTTKLRASNVSYTRNFNVEKMEQLLTLWTDYLNQKRSPLTQHAIAANARSLFDEIQHK